MITTCWILLIAFGFVGFLVSVKMMTTRVTGCELSLWILCVFVVAISYGIIDAGSWSVFIS